MRSYVECLDSNKRLTCMKSYNDCSLEAMERSRKRKKNVVGSNNINIDKSNKNNKNVDHNYNRNPRPRPVLGIISRIQPGMSKHDPSVRPALGDGEIFCNSCLTAGVMKYGYG